MKKEDLLKSIAEAGYNVGFGAKKHFATYDIVSKVPGVIGFASITVGIFALFIDSLSTKHLSAAFIVLGVSGLYINRYDHKKKNYADIGGKLTELFNRLKSLYYNVKSSEETDMSQFENDLEGIEKEFNSTCISDQILLSDWFAHYKFFWQHQIDWIDEQKQFRFFRDKIPLSLIIMVAFLLIAGLIAWLV